MPIQHLLLALLINLAWAFNFIAGKLGVAHFQPLLFSSLRFTLLLGLLWPWLRPADARQRLALLQVGLTLGIGHFSLMFLGLALSTDISSVAILGQLYIPFSSLLAVFWLGERMSLQQIIGVSVAFLGVMLIGFDPVVFQHLDAALLVLGAALLMAVATVQMRQLRGVGVFTLQGWIALCGAPGLLLLSLLFEQQQWQALTSASWQHWAAPIYSALGASLLGHGLLSYLLRHYPVSVTAPLLLFTPVFAVALGVLVWGDQLTWKLVAGGLLTLLGIAVVTWQPKKFRKNTV